MYTVVYTLGIHITKIIQFTKLNHLHKSIVLDSFPNDSLLIQRLHFFQEILEIKKHTIKNF